MDNPDTPVRYRWLRLILVVATLGAAGAAQYWLSIQRIPVQAAYAWGAAAIGFVLLFALGRDARRLPVPETAGLSGRTETALLILVLCVGAFFTFFEIGEFPPGLNHDAAWEAMYGIRILNGERYTPYANEAWGRETLTFYFKAASLWLLGPTRFAVQLPSLLAGFATLVFFYWWARNTFGAVVALLATLFLGASGWHLIFSRTGWRSDFQPFFTAITCCFFVRGMRTARPTDFFLSGLALAATLNTYNAARVLPGVFALWLPLAMIQAESPVAFLKRYASGVAFMVAAFSIAIAPLASFAYRNWMVFQSRAAALRGQATAAEAFVSSFLVFNVKGNGDDFFVLDPALEYPVAILLVFGALWCLLSIRNRWAQFLVIGFLIGLVPGWVSKPNMNRCVGTMPFVYFFVALGAVFFAQQLRRLVPRIGSILATALLVASGAASVYATYAQYLGPNRRHVWGYYPETSVVGEYLRGLVPKYTIWVGGANFPRDTLTFLSYQGNGHPERRNYTWIEDVRALTRANAVPEPGKGIAFVVATIDRGPAVLAELERRYPTKTVTDLQYPPGSGQVIARAILVEAADVAAAPTIPGARSLPVNRYLDITGVGTAPAPIVEPADQVLSVPTPTRAPAASKAPAGTMNQPRGISLTADGHVLVSDFGNHRLQEFDSAFAFVREWGERGEEPGNLNEPGDVAAGPGGEVFVADTWNNRVQVFSADGRYLRSWSDAFFGPRGIAVDRQGTVYVADTGNNRVAAYSSQGTKKLAWGKPGSSPGSFTEPIGIATDEAGLVYVADNGNGRLQIFRPDGALVRSFPVEGWQSAAWSEPHIAIGDGGTIWVTVPAQREIRAYDAEGKLSGKIVAVDGNPFGQAMGIAYDRNTKELVVSDLRNRLVRLPARTP